MATKRKWTTKEDNLIIRTVKDSFYNLQEGFKKVAAKIKRTPQAVSQRWYRTLSNPNSKGHVDNICFITVGSKRRLCNRKTYIKGVNAIAPIA